MQSYNTIVQVLYSLSLGGSEVLGRDIATGLHNNGYRFAMCALEKGGEIEDDLSATGIPFFIAHRKPDEYLSVMLRIYDFFKIMKPAIVHTHHLYELFYSVFGAKLVGATIIHTEHEYFSLSNAKAKRQLKVLSPFCKKITTVGEEITEFLHKEIGIPSDKLLTIQNGICLEKFSRRTTLSKRDIGFTEQDKIIGIVARLERAKDHVTLFNAFKEVLKSEKNAGLLIVGDGSLRHELETLSKNIGIAEKVRFLGSRRDIPELLSIMDVFVLSSIEEGLPISLLEAMASATPVIATRVGSIPDVIQDQVNGVLIMPNDPNKMSEAIKHIIRDETYATKLSIQGRATINQRFSFQDTLTKYQSLYAEVIDSLRK